MAGERTRKQACRPVLALLILLASALACGEAAPPEPTATQYPTDTPYPTYTSAPEPTDTPQPTNTPTPTPEFVVIELAIARVVEVIDGDTIKVEHLDEIYTVRYIGIDTWVTPRSQPIRPM